MPPKCPLLSPPVRIVAAHEIVVPSVDETLDLLRTDAQLAQGRAVHRVKLAHGLAPRSPAPEPGPKPLDKIEAKGQGVWPSCGLGNVRRSHCLPRERGELFSPATLRMELAVQLY